MSGVKDPTEPPKPKDPEPVVEKNGLWSLLQSPIILSVTSSLCQQYRALTESTDSLNALLDNTKNHLTEGIQYVAPIPGKVASALETPFNNAVQIGQNFFGEVVPSVAGIKDYLRSTLAITIHWLDSALVTLRNQLAHISASIEDAPRDPRKDTGGKRNQ